VKISTANLFVTHTWLVDTSTHPGR